VVTDSITGRNHLDIGGIIKGKKSMKKTRDALNGSSKHFEVCGEQLSPSVNPNHLRKRSQSSMSSPHHSAHDFIKQETEDS